MKAQTKIVGGMPTQEQKINWDEPMWLISDDIIVKSTGKHDTLSFSAYALTGISRAYVTDGWTKSAFTPITSPITIEISNV